MNVALCCVNIENSETVSQLAVMKVCCSLSLLRSLSFNLCENSYYNLFQTVKSALIPVLLQ